MKNSTLKAPTSSRQLKIEELKKQLENASHTAERVGLLQELCRHLKRWNNAEAISCASEALRLSRTIRDNRLIATSLYQLGHAEATAGRHHVALDHFHEARRIFRMSRDTQREHETLYLIVTIYKVLGRQEEALRISQDLLEYFRRNDDRLWIVRTLSTIGMIQTTFTEYAEALNALLEAIEISLQDDYLEELCRLYNAVAPVYREIGDLDKAIFFYHAGIAVYEQLGDPMGSAIASSNLGWHHRYTGNFAQAFHYLVRALRAFHRLDQNDREGNAWNNLGTVYYDQGNMEKAERCFMKALEILQNTVQPHFRVTVYENLAHIFMNKGEYAEAIRYGEKALQLAEKTRNVPQEVKTLNLLSILHEKAENVSEALRYAVLYKEKNREAYTPEKIKKAMDASYRNRIQALEQEIGQREEALLKLQSTMERKDMTLSMMALQLLQKESADKKLKKGTSKTEALPSDKRWEALIGQISKVDQSFYHWIARTYPDLTTTECKVCTLVRLGMISKQIAEILGTSTRTVEVHRQNIRRKLNLASRKSLNAFIASL